eukprot:168268-Amphidinium_carterae.5
MLAELRRWHSYGCFSRKLRRLATNVIDLDLKWVMKWKHIRDEATGNSASSSLCMGSTHERYEPALQRGASKIYSRSQRTSQALRRGAANDGS